MFDVIVIGGRCAGSSVALLLARAGHRVLLVERAEFPSETVSTHLLKPRAMAYLRRWGLRDALAAVTPVHSSFAFARDGIRLEGAPSVAALAQRMQAIHGKAYAIADETIEVSCVKRSVLDTLLLEAAAAAGVEVLQDCRAEGLLRKDDRVVGVQLETAQGPIEARARLVIGADGRHSEIREWVGARQLAAGSTCTYTAYSYFKGIPAALSRPGAFLNGRLGVGLGETNDGETMISVYGPVDWFPEFRDDVNGNMLRTVQQCHPDLAAAMADPDSRVDSFHCTTDLRNAVYETHGPGWLLIGDAACHLDQCTAIGITHAFRDAALASTWVGTGLGGERSMSEALAHYARIREAELRPQFDYVAMVSECRLPSREHLAFLAALGEDRSALERFLGFGAAIVARSDYFTAEETATLAARGRSGLPDEQIWQQRAELLARNPWA